MQHLQRHQDNGGAAADSHDRFLFPTTGAKGGKIGFSVKNGCIKLSEDFSSNNNNHHQNGENPSLSGKKGKSRQTRFCARGHWKPSEDAKLRELVAAYGPQNWNLIAEKLEGRSGKSCRLRWYNQIDPKINKRAYTEEEEERLMEAHRIYGNKWAFISRFFPGRTDNSVKNHWHVLMARRYREKPKSYLKTEWRSYQPTLIEQRLMQETAYNSVNNNVLQLQSHYGEQVVGSNYDHFVRGISSVKLCSGKPYSPGSTSPISPEPSSADQWQESTSFLESTTPEFIDFLGVGAI